MFLVSLGNKNRLIRFFLSLNFHFLTRWIPPLKLNDVTALVLEPKKYWVQPEGAWRTKCVSYIKAVKILSDGGFPCQILEIAAVLEYFDPPIPVVNK